MTRVHRLCIVIGKETHSEVRREEIGQEGA